MDETKEFGEQRAELPAMPPIPKEFPDNVELWMMIEEPPPITLDLRFCSQFLDVFGQF
ncbi:17147_t:CDS:2 [Rhizophagus irregularis]|nr:17147_t:CDS:2 [Rhizophagus irregularis]